MSKQIMQVESTKKVVGIANPEKVKLYDKIAEYIAECYDGEVYHVKPKTVEDKATKKKKKTGGYGLLFKLPGGSFCTCELVIKSDGTSLDDYTVEATTISDAKSETENAEPENESENEEMENVNDAMDAENMNVV